MRTVICISLDVNTLLMDVKADFAIPILLLISFSHLASEVNWLPKYTNECTCSSILPWTLMLHVGICEAFENTMVKDFALFKYRPFSSLFVTTTLINTLQLFHRFGYDHRIICIPKIYFQLWPPILKPSLSSSSLIIISVYNANKWGEATSLSYTLFDIQPFTDVVTTPNSSCLFPIKIG